MELSSNLITKHQHDIMAAIHTAETSFDNGDFTAHESLLEDDFNFSSPFGSFDNATDYMQWLISFYEIVNNQGGTRHIVLNPVITQLNEQQVLVKSYLIIFNRKSMAVMGTSVIHDTLSLTERGWKFIARKLFSDQYASQEALKR